LAFLAGRARQMFRILRLHSEFLARATLVAFPVVLTHQLHWNWLRFATSEAVLRASAMAGLATERVSLDVIRVEGELFRFVTSCTFIDVCMGSIPLLWVLRKSLLWNASWLTLVQSMFMAFNLVRLVVAQILHARGLPWIIADQVIGGIAYFAVWLVIWSLRSWSFTAGDRLPVTPVVAPS
jgi:hypothetical protein